MNFSEGNILILIALLIIGGALISPLFWCLKKIRTQVKPSLVKKVFRAVTLPLNFYALFLEKRKLEQYPAYYRFFLKFTRLTSRIKYFHFFPKALIALIAEGIIMFFTGNQILTGVIFSWSILFLILVSMVEEKFGEIDEGTVTLANVLFFYTVSLITLLLLIIHFFLWGLLEPFFNSWFFQFIAEFAHWFNSLLLTTLHLFWEASLGIQIFVIVIIILYIITSLHLSRKSK